MTSKSARERAGVWKLPSLELDTERSRDGRTITLTCCTEISSVDGKDIKHEIILSNNYFHTLLWNLVSQNMIITFLLYNSFDEFILKYIFGKMYF